MPHLCLEPRPAGPPASPPNRVPFVSVVVPVRNEARYIGRTLQQLLGQDYDPGRFEVLVADGRSTDETRAIVREAEARHPQLRLLDNPRGWSSAGRNVAVRAARGDLIVVVDGHADVDNPRYLADLAEAFRASGADCIGRPQPLDVAGARPVQRAIAAARSSWLGHHPASWIYSSGERFVRPQSVGVAYRREVFETLGLFDEEFDACEDVEFNHRLDRAGMRCFLSARVRVRYHPRAGLPGLFRQLCRYGRGRVRLFCKHPETLSLSCLLPAAVLAGLAAGAVGAALSAAVAAAFALACGVYAATVLGASAAIAVRRRDAGCLAWLPLVFAAIHAGAGAGVHLELARQAPRLLARRRLGTRPEPARLRLHPAADGPRRRAEGGPVLNALTVDVEEYFQVTGFERFVDRGRWHEFESRLDVGTHKILRALDAASVRATFFVLGWVADRHPRLVRTIQAAGHEIGCHSYWHRLVYRQTPDEFRADLRRAQAAIGNVTGAPVVAYRAPCFSVTRRSLWALDVLIEEGFRLDSSIYPTLHDRYGLPGAPDRPHRLLRPAGSLWEYPLAVYRLAGYPLPVGGGGYFRLYPYALTRRGLAAINAAGQPAVAYLHPWELDPDQPRLRMGRLASFRHYVNLHRTEQRLRRLLGDFRWGPLSAVHSHLHESGNLPPWDLTQAA
jgi:polysaccharide deacetylase family protein (PEP-CTERM system associated)